MSRFDPALVTARREAAGLSRENLAAVIDQPASVVADIERGRVRPSLSLQGKLTLALGCPLREFYSGDGDPDLADDDESIPSELGAETDRWVRAQLASAPPMSEETARRVSAVLFPPTGPGRAGGGAA